VSCFLVGGRAAWVVIASGGGGEAQQSAQFGQSTAQTVFLEEVGLIEVISTGHNNFVLHHPDTGEVLEISPIFDALGGAGVPGGADAGAMQISSFVRSRPQRRQQEPQQKQQQQRQQANAKEAGAGQATADDGRKEKAQKQGGVSAVANQQRLLEDDDGLEGSRGRAETEAPVTVRGMDDDGVTGTRGASEEEEELEVRVPGSDGARTAGEAAAPTPAPVVSGTAIDDGEEYEKEEVERDEERGERGQDGELEGEDGGAGEGLHRSRHGAGDQHTGGSGRQNRRVRRRPAQRRTFIVTKEAKIAEAAGAVGLVVINNEPGGVTLTMPGASNAGVYDDEEDEDEEEQGGSDVRGNGVSIPVAMVGLEDGVEIMKILSAAATAGVDEEVHMQGVLDARTLHDSVLSRLVEEQKEGLRDNRGSLLPAAAAAGCSGSSGGDDSGSRHACSGSGSPTPPRESWQGAGGDGGDGSGGGKVADDRFPSRDNGNGAGKIPAADTVLQDVGSSGGGIDVVGEGAGDEARSDVDGPFGAAADAGTGAMPNRGGQGEDRSPVEEAVEEAVEEVEGDDDSSTQKDSDGDRDSGNNPFPFLSSGFDEATLGGMRLPPFPLPRAVVGDGYVQV
ncbi:unnamed protein product, partial [Ectocarpus fasciculatus]